MRCSLYTATLLLTTAVRVSGEPIRGVNLGGWLLIERWITPSLFASTNTDDEWSLCNELGKDKCAKRLGDHWNSFFDRSDFVDIKSAGLNAVRIPVGYWAVDVRDYEPYVSGQYPYLIRAVQWARELGLQVLIDLHGAPGSQNGNDHSGLIGPILFPSNSSNADRSVAVLRNLTEEFSGDAYGGIVTGIELLNEPRPFTSDFPITLLKSFYANASSTIRKADPSNTLNITIHDAFYNPTYWRNYDPSSSSASAPAVNLVVDTHQYYAFPPVNNLTQREMLEAICTTSSLIKSPLSSKIPPTIVGEWSLQTNISPSSSSTPGTRTNDQARRTWFRLLFEAQAVAYTPNRPGQIGLGWYYWTWKTEWDIDTWSYRKGVADGYIPKDVSNSSTYAFPVKDNGCIDAGFEYTAPLRAGSGRMESWRVGTLLGLAFWAGVIPFWI